MKVLVAAILLLAAGCGGQGTASGTASGPASASGTGAVPLLPAVAVDDFVRPLRYALPAEPAIEVRHLSRQSVVFIGPDESRLWLWVLDGRGSGVLEPCLSGVLDNYVALPDTATGIVEYLGALPGATVSPAGEGSLGGVSATAIDVTLAGCPSPIVWRTALLAGVDELRLEDGEAMRLLLAEVDGGILAAAVASPDLDAWLPTASRLLDALELPPLPVPEQCSASIEYQIAFDVPGEDEVEVTCGIVYKQVDGLDASLDLYLPPGTQAEERLPAVIFVHGNEELPTELPFREAWSRLGYEQGRMVAASGLAGIAIAYRGYRDVASLAEAQKDVLDVIAYVAAHADELRVDPERLCVWGTSGGGYPTAWAAIFGEPQPRCAVAFSASLDASWAPERNPAEFVSADTPPFFVGRGRADPYGSVSRFIERAGEHGVEVVYETHAGGHGFEGERDPEQQRIVAAALAFVRAQLSADDGS